MGKVIKKKIQGMNWLMKTSLVLLLTLTTMVFMYEGWYKPRQAAAAVGVLNAWSSQYASATYPAGAINAAYTIGAGSQRLLVVAIATTATTSVAQTISNVTWGGQTLTAASSNVTDATQWNHSAIYYLEESKIAAAVGSSLNVTITGGTSYYTTVAAAVYTGVDQSTFFTSVQSTQATKATSTVGPFSPGLAINAGDQAIEVVNVARSATGSTARTIATWATTWNTAGLASSAITTSGPNFQSYVRERNVITAGPDTSQHSASSANSWYAMTGVVLKLGPVGNTLTVANTTVQATAPTQGNTNIVMQRLTLTASAGTIALNDLTLNDIGTSTSIAQARVYIDTAATFSLGTATQVAATAAPWTPGATVLSLSGQSVTVGTPKYIYIVYDVGTLSTIQSSVTAFTVGGTDSVSGTFPMNSAGPFTLVAAPSDTLTVGTNTPIAVASSDSNAGVVMQRVKLDSNTAGNGIVDLSTLTLDDSTATATLYANAKIYIDTTASATLPGTAVLIGSQAAFTGGSTVISLTGGTAADRTITNPTSRYLYVVYDMQSGQAPLTAGSRITAIGVAGADTVAGLPLASSIFALTTGPVSTISSCNDCHFKGGVADGTARNTPAGQFQGSHGTHAGSAAGQYGNACTDCHTNNAAYDHANGNVNMANPINGNTGASYSKTATFPVSNTFSGGTCSATYCHSNGTSVATGTIPANTSPAWGGTTTCTSCHGTLADGRPNYATGTPKANSHEGTTHLAQACTRCHDSVTGTAGNYTPVTTLHANGSYNVGAASVGYTYVSTGGTCNATGTGCHNTSTIAWGASLACLDCHTATALSAPNASSISSGTVTQRRGISTEFGLTSNHTRSRGTVTSEDCGVCHMEGNPTNGSKNTNASTAGIVGGQFHGNGVIELRDPDTGATIIAQSWSQALPSNTQGAFANKAGTPVAAFVQFSRNLATRPELETALVWPNTTNAGLYPSTTNTLFEVNSAIQKQHCLGCHDAAGAAGTGTGASASKIPTGSALNPFAATITTNGMTASLRVLDVKSQFESTNRSYHPVLYKQNNGYAGSTRMVAPWNNVAKSGTTTVFGPLITCWDCHAGDNATTAITSTVTHGGALAGTNRVPLRGQTNVASSTNGQSNYCLFCHLGYTASAAGHAAGSAFVTNTQGTGRTMTGMNTTCTGCHSSIGAAGTKPARPYGAADAHGYDVKGPTAAVPNGAFAAGQGYAFIRANTFYGVTNYQQRVANVGGTAYVPTCGGATTTGSGFCGRADMGGAAPTVTKAYDPGGSF